MTFSQFAAFLNRLKALFARGRLDRDLDDEIAFHLAMREEDAWRQGTPAKEALDSRRQFGSALRTKERSRDAWTFNWLDSILQDVRFALRGLRRSPGFAGVAMFTLAVGIAATTATFSASETLLLRPLPYRESERLVVLRGVNRGHLYDRVSAGTLADWQLEAQSFEAIAGYRWYTADVLGAPGNERLRGLFATPEFFEVFGVAIEGRGFHPEDRKTRAVVLGHDLWHRRLNADGSYIGSTLTLNVRNFSRAGPTPHRVLGTATAPVRFPPLTADFQLGMAGGLDTIDFWAPEWVSPISSRQNPELDVVGRLRPGVTIAHAQAEMDAIVARQVEKHPDSSLSGVRVVSLREQVAGRSRSGVLLLGSATWMLLLIACANVAMLLLSRSVVREREVAIRAALGASRSRIVRQFLLEAAVLAGLASALGAALAAMAVELARPWLPLSLSILAEMEVNSTVAAFAVGCAVVTACLTGLAPAVRALRGDTGAVAGRQGTSLTPRRNRLVGVYVCAEVALVVMLLEGTGLLGRSALAAWRVDPGFDPTDVLTMTVSLPENKFSWNHNAVFARDVIEAVRTLPSVVGAAVVQGLPMRVGSFYGVGQVEGYVPQSGVDLPTWRIRVISTDYFDVMRVPIVAGRAFDSRDEQGEVGFSRNVIVSEAFVDRYWPGQNPLGKRIGSPERWETVVGVAGNVRYAGLEAEPTLDVYYPDALFPQAAVTLVVRTGSDPRHAVADIRARIRSVDADAFVTDIRTMDEVIGASQAERRAGTLLVAVISVLAFVLVLAGVYSVIAQSVVQRQLEWAIRVALGAEPRRIIHLAMRSGLSPAFLGIVVGVLGGLATTRLMTSVLFGVDSMDGITWFGMCGVVLMACVGAAYVPARRAALVAPMTALKAE
jgi:predicted permease